MALLEQTIEELRELNQLIRDDKVSDKKVSQHIAVFSQIEKHTKLIIATKAMSYKYGNKVLGHFKQANITDGCVSLKDEEEDQSFRCRNNNKIITKSQCLEFSGKNINECNSCKYVSELRQELRVA